MPFWKNSPIFEVVEEGKEFSRKEDDALYDVEIRVEDDAGGFKAFRTNKTILAFTSPVFKQQFFGSMSSTNSRDSNQNKMEIVNIQGYSYNMVKDFIELIVTSNFSIVDTAEDMGYLYEMLKIADMYEVHGLDVVHLVKERIASVRITTANAMKAASVAEMHKGLENFEDVSDGVIRRCAAVIHDTCRNIQELCRVMSSTKGDEELVGSLIKQGFWNIFFF